MVYHRRIIWNIIVNILHRLIMFDECHHGLVIHCLVIIYRVVHLNQRVLVLVRNSNENVNECPKNFKQQMKIISILVGHEDIWHQLGIINTEINRQWMKHLFYQRILFHKILIIMEIIGIELNGLHEN